jgi:hypothetical protein
MVVVLEHIESIERNARLHCGRAGAISGAVRAAIRLRWLVGVQLHAGRQQTGATRSDEGPLDLLA